MGLCSSSESEKNIFKNDRYANYKVVFSKDQLEEIFDKYDSDKDDMLVIEDVENMIKDMLEAILQIQIRSLSTKSSLRPLIAKFKKRIETAKENYKWHAQRLLNTLDVDKNGKISKSEFYTYIQELQRSRREGVIGVLAAGEDGSLIVTHSHYIAKKEKEGSLFAQSPEDLKKYKRNARGSASTPVIRRGIKSPSKKKKDETKAGDEKKSNRGLAKTALKPGETEIDTVSLDVVSEVRRQGTNDKSAPASKKAVQAVDERPPENAPNDDNPIKPDDVEIKMTVD